MATHAGAAQQSGRDAAARSAVIGSTAKRKAPIAAPGAQQHPTASSYPSPARRFSPNHLLGRCPAFLAVLFIFLLLFLLPILLSVSFSYTLAKDSSSFPFLPLLSKPIAKMVQSAVLGFPRMGVNRDLKKATENCESFSPLDVTKKVF